VRLQQEGERKAGEIEREKMEVYKEMLLKRKQGNPSHEELLLHKHKYAVLKQQEELRKQEARDYREQEWKHMKDAIDEKNDAVVSHVPPSLSPLKRRSSAGSGGEQGETCGVTCIRLWVTWTFCWVTCTLCVYFVGLCVCLPLYTLLHTIIYML
jgi:hypothetical protein